MRYDEEDLYWGCFVLFIVGLLIIGPAVGAIMAAIVKMLFFAK